MSAIRDFYLRGHRLRPARQNQLGVSCHLLVKVVVFSVSSWKGASIVLAVINCGMPPSPTMTTFSGNDFDYGGRVTYSCDYGYCWTGSMSIRCSDSGRWEGMLPKCQRKNEFY